MDVMELTTELKRSPRAAGRPAGAGLRRGRRLAGHRPRRLARQLPWQPHGRGPGCHGNARDVWSVPSAGHRDVYSMYVLVHYHTYYYKVQLRVYVCVYPVLIYLKRFPSVFFDLFLSD